MQCDAYFGSSPRILSWGETRGTLPCARRKGVGSRAAPVADRGALREEDGEEESAAYCSDFFPSLTLLSLSAFVALPFLSLPLLSLGRGALREEDGEEESAAYTLRQKVS